MQGPYDNDISSLLDVNLNQELRDDLEILEEYLAGVLLPPSLEEIQQEFSADTSSELESNVYSDDFSPSASSEMDEEVAAPSFTTSTMAEIYVSQGFIQRAIDIYEEMLRENPSNDGIVHRIGELLDMLVPAAEEQLPIEGVAEPLIASESVFATGTGEREVVSTLEQWLSNIKSSRRR